MLKKVAGSNPDRVGLAGDSKTLSVNQAVNGYFSKSGRDKAAMTEGAQRAYGAKMTSCLMCPLGETPPFYAVPKIQASSPSAPKPLCCGKHFPLLTI